MITKSARKANRQNIKRRAHNSKKKSALKKLIKDFRKSVSSKNIGENKEIVSKIQKALDKATKTNLIKKNKASRIKSRLSRLANKK
ncbi:30S ribosomal protein S20 [Patescibacteria group bacterium]|nr:30S ribosomal protein S20 [Patescibacteria group bacterium]